ncbi:hypothetical protein [Azospirillum himalayense]|uniref:Uncharacterized protein n=1 Tax=Azospirillum himalayense TaxID=654847 RepID=A0ABW0FYZ7_9PROT
MIEAIRKFALAHAGTQEAEVVNAVCDQLAETQRRHAERSERIKHSMARGARLTDHRIKL